MNGWLRWLGIVLLICGFAAQAQNYPAKPIRFIVGYAPGGSADVMARAVVAQLQRQIGTSLVIDNRAGAGGLIAYDLVAKAEPDGYTLLVISSSFVTSVAVYPKLPFDYRKDFTAVAQFASGPANLLVVSATFPGNTLKELLELAKNRDKPVTYGSPGIGSVQHFVAEMFNMSAGVKLSHIPYKGQAPALTALLGNEVQLAFLQPPGGLDLVKNGRLKVIAYAGSSRWAAMPNVPTVAESGVPEFQIKGPFEGVLGPRGMPKAVVARLHDEIRNAIEAPQLKAFFAAAGWEGDLRGPDAFQQFLNAEVERYGRISRAANIKSE